MQDLRLIGVHEDGHHLLLADAEGGRFRLPLDEALRAAARRDRPRLGQLQIEIEGGLRPREVQSLIRRGLSAEEVADRAGWTVEKVRRFEGPVLAEREHVARVAQQCAVGSRGSGPVTLAERVNDRLKDRGVDRDDIEWDSSRDEEGHWALTMTFAAGGRQRTATWRYEPLGGSVAPANDEARWLSEEAAPGSIPTPHTAASADHDVYDVDADGGLGRTRAPAGLPRADRPHGRDARAQHPRPSRAQPPSVPRVARPATTTRGTTRSPSRSSPSTRRPSRRLRRPGPATPVSAHLDEPGDDRPDELVGGFPEDVGDEASRRPADDSADDDRRRDSRSAAAADDEPAAAPAPARRPAASRKGRPSVPSWDDIVFGTKGS